MVEELQSRVGCVRVGNPARVIDSVVKRSLDFLIASNSSTWKGEVKKLLAARKRLSKATSRD